MLDFSSETRLFYIYDISFCQLFCFSCYLNFFYIKDKYILFIKKKAHCNFVNLPPLQFVLSASQVLITSFFSFQPLQPIKPHAIIPQFQFMTKKNYSENCYHLAAVNCYSEEYHAFSLLLLTTIYFTFLEKRKQNC
jgi:hypothetical protein